MGFAVKFHLFLGEYNECAYLYKKAVDAETDAIHAYVRVDFWTVCVSTEYSAALI